MRVIFDAPERLGFNDEYTLHRVAVHEAGHAIIAEILEPGSVNLISINPHGGDVGGFTSYNNNEHYFSSISYMKERVIALLGGKAATEIVFAEADVGCNRDMHRAFDIVERFVDNYCEFGFDKFERGSSSNTLYEKKETFVHAELDRYYIQAKKIITENRAFFDKLVSALIENKTLTSKDIAKIKSSLNG
jgi:cell division protease FtsH